MINSEISILFVRVCFLKALLASAACKQNNLLSYFSPFQACDTFMRDGTKLRAYLDLSNKIGICSCIIFGLMGTITAATKAVLAEQIPLSGSETIFQNGQ